jgi:hypothetical protein
MTDELKTLAHLWDGRDPGWVLVRDATGAGDSPATSAHIYNTRTREVLLIEDDETARKVRERMLLEKVTLLDDFPPGDFIG